MLAKKINAKYFADILLISMEETIGDGLLIEETIPDTFDMEKNVMDKITVDKIYDRLNKKQRFIVDEIWAEKIQSEIAEELGVSRQSVNEILTSIKNRFIKNGMI
jgi:DNA-directed RNA polymerase specialized sigma subunit